MHTTNIILYAIIAFRWIASLAQIQPENVTRYLNPALLYSMQLPNASIDGIAASRITGDELHLDLYLSVNQLQSSNTSSDEPMEEGWVYKIKGATKNANATPEITSRKILTFPGTTTSFVGACMYWKDANLIILNPGVKESSVSTASGETWIDGTAAHISNSGIIAIDPDTLHVRWISTVAWTSDRGVPAMAVPLPVNGTNETHLPKIVFRSHRAGLTVLDARGQTIWATTQIRPGAIVVTPSVIYALDQTPSTGYPLNVHSVETGELLGSTGPYQSGSTQTGVVMSRDARYIYAMRNGLQGGLHRYRADFVFAPSTILTTEISAGRTKKMISGNIAMYCNGSFLSSMCPLHPLLFGFCSNSSTIRSPHFAGGYHPLHRKSHAGFHRSLQSCWTCIALEGYYVSHRATVAVHGRYCPIFVPV